MVIKTVTLPKDEQIPPWYTPITKELLKEITRRIVERFQPERIILFGSYAYGKPTIQSDIDLLVITNRLRNKRVAERDRLVAHVANLEWLAMDVMVRTPSEVGRRLKMSDPFFQEVLDKGLVLYAPARPRRRMDPRSRRRLPRRTRPRAAA